MKKNFILMIALIGGVSAQAQPDGLGQAQRGNSDWFERAQSLFNDFFFKA